MAVPKRKTSAQRRDKRRTHYTIQAKQLAKCDHCGAPKQPHRVCDACGYYGGREVMQPQDA